MYRECDRTPDFGMAGSVIVCKVTDVVRVSTDELQLVLHNNPRIGRLLSLQLSREGETSPAIVAKVTAATLRPQGGWLVHCTPVLPLTRSHIGTADRALFA